jgi:GH15 family glucan-1,4-alpha-glucosidase
MENLDYGIIGNCRTAALVSRDGSIDWLCFPDFDSQSVFAKILDKGKGGSFGIETDEGYIATQRYINGTNVLCTTFSNGKDSFEVLDFMPRYKTGDDATDYYLPAEVYRYVRVLDGSPSFRVRYNPSLNYAREEVKHEIAGGYIRSGSVADQRNSVYLYSSISLDKIVEGEDIWPSNEEFFLLSYNQKLINVDIRRVYLEYSRTKVYWLNWINRSKRFHEYSDVVERSMLILKLMSYQPTGAVLAAVTTSIPETIGEVRNWDYRFCWLRDASMSIETLMSMGHQGAARRFISFVKSIIRSKNDTFQIMYGIRGERILTEEILPHFAGYEGSSPVRIGNAAYHQKQNDSLGYLMDVIYKYYLYFPGTLDEIEDIWEVVKNIVRTVYEEWRNPDQGIWEIRNSSSHFVFSKVMCWVALDRAVRIAQLLDKESYAGEWKKEADEIRRDIHTNGWKEELGSFSQTYSNMEADSSLLLMEEYGFIEATDPKYIRTVHTIEEKLMHKGLMFRYKNHDDFGLPSSAFTICTFWLIRALYVTGQEEAARQLFDQLLSYSNHLGLFSEDLDFDTKRQLGNFPQAYSHLALINTVELLAREKIGSRFIKP